VKLVIVKQTDRQTDKPWVKHNPPLGEGNYADKSESISLIFALTSGGAAESAVGW